MIGVPGHKKDIVDAVNTCDKRYLPKNVYGRDIRSGR